MSFPSNPTNGQQTTVNGVIYTYNSTLTAWTVNTDSGANVSAVSIVTTGNASIGGTLTTANLVVTGTTSLSAGSFTANTIASSGAISGTNITGSGTISATGTVTGGNLATGGTITATGTLTTSDITTVRTAAPTTGYVYYGNSGTKYAGFNGTNFVSSMPMSFNITGSAATVTTGAQPSITSVGTLSSLVVSGTVTAGGFSTAIGNISAGNITATHYGSGAGLSSITGANVTGTVANATYATSAGSATTAVSSTTAATVTTAAQPNITSVGTLTTLAVTGALSGGNTTLTSVGVGTTASGVSGELRATNAITAYYSDRRLKTEIGQIENALDKIDQLTGVIYTQNKLAESFGYNNYEPQVGLYAQDVLLAQPEVVKPAPFDIAEDGNSKSGENYLTVQYEKLVPLLVEGVKELRAELKIIKASINTSQDQ